MQYRNFGKTDLKVSEVGFGAWAIGGPAMAGDIPIGWGEVQDGQSEAAIKKALDLGINFFDTADFYGLGHSEKLLGKILGREKDILIATKVGHRLTDEQEIRQDYSKAYILQACEASLRRLGRDCIDFYQLHAARMPDLENGACLEAMELLQQQGKIRYWGLSLNTFEPAPEADWLLERGLGQGFQIVLNLINQRGLPIIRRAGEAGFGIIARMPLQFGLLTGKFDKSTRFPENDHRAFRLPPDLLADALDALEPVWQLGKKYELDKTGLAMSFILSIPEVSTVIPGIKTAAQAESNAGSIKKLAPEDVDALWQLYTDQLEPLVHRMR
jgi:aryl-alcohol dehydrogenase-like predicted oxidoreductase